MKIFVSVVLLCSLCVACHLDPESAPATASPQAVAPWGAWAESNPSWVKSVPAHRIIDNVYYVGSEGLGSYLIATDAGHILLDGGLPQNASMIIDSISSLGFDIRDVKTLINSHAHFDHSGGLAELRAASGAILIATEEDRSALEGGFYLGSEDNQTYSAPKVEVDQVIGDGGTLTIGDSTLTARLTPGHTRGCTTWTMTAQELGQRYDVLFFCSASVAGNRLAPPQYEGVVEDYRETFAKTRLWRPDVPLSNHPNFYFGQLGKMKALLESGNKNDGLAFIDRQSFSQTMHKLEKRFVRSLAKQRDDSGRLEDYQFSPSKFPPSARFLFYLHGKIVEDEGVNAVSPEHGAYQYLDILDRFEEAGFTVYSEVRDATADVNDYARKVSIQVEALIAQGVPADHITIVGASKGAYIASLVSHYLHEPRLSTVLLAACSSGVVRSMLKENIDVHGRFLAIRDVSDTNGAGSCQSVFDSSKGVTEAQELVLSTGLAHGLIYRPLDAWFEPLDAWSKK